MALLEVKNVSKIFGGLQALNGVNMELNRGEIFALIGPNGAGKTTLFNVITGSFSPSAGQILFKGDDITGLQPHEICFRGISRTFQLVKPFEEMSVFDNVMIGSFNRTGSQVRAEEQAREILEFTGLAGRGRKLASELTIADRKRLELARALATRPEILMLDEVMTGLTHSECDTALELVRRIRDQGVTVLLIEHVMRAVMRLSERIVVLHYGKVIAEGTPGEICRNQSVIEAYLGSQSFATHPGN
jgi:branched-chain amino acid transport system ATP-binding protein